MSRFDVIAFDADDTLWHNERLYDQTQAGLAALIFDYRHFGASDGRPRQLVSPRQSQRKSRMMASSCLTVRTVRPPSHSSRVAVMASSGGESAHLPGACRRAAPP